MHAYSDHAALEQSGPRQSPSVGYGGRRRRARATRRRDPFATNESSGGRPGHPLPSDRRDGMTIRMMLLAGAAAAAVWWAGPLRAAPLIGVVGGTQLVQFDSGNVNGVQARLSVSGLGGETLQAIDVRPATGALFGLGSAGNIYSIDTTTGVATKLTTIPIGTAGLAQIGFAFNPQPDRIRIESGRLNLRANPNDGNLVPNQPDGPLTYDVGDPTVPRAPDVNAGQIPNVSAVAYTNQVPGIVTTTELFVIDANLGVLALQNPPNLGTLRTIGSLLLDDPLDPSKPQSFDIDGVTGTAFALLTTATGPSILHSIDLRTGEATPLGAFLGNRVEEFAFGTLAVPEPATLSVLGAGLLGLAALRRRRRA
jgi:hypothetical protein